MDANVRGPWYMAKAVGTYWMETGIRGKVLMMSPARGRHGAVSRYTDHCTSKGEICADPDAADRVGRNPSVFPNAVTHVSPLTGRRAMPPEKATRFAVGPVALDGRGAEFLAIFTILILRSTTIS